MRPELQFFYDPDMRLVSARCSLCGQLMPPRPRCATQPIRSCGCLSSSSNKAPQAPHGRPYGELDKIRRH
jgi:hypothetical protein